MIVKNETLIKHSNSDGEIIGLCPNCNSLVIGKFIFCPGCGDKLQWEFKGDFMNKDGASDENYQHERNDKS
jgi:hypothetical protein